MFNDKFGFRINGLGAVTVFTSGLLQSTIVVVLFLNVAFTLNIKLDQSKKLKSVKFLTQKEEILYLI